MHCTHLNACDSVNFNKVWIIQMLTIWKRSYKARVWYESRQQAAMWYKEYDAHMEVIKSSEWELKSIEIFHHIVHTHLLIQNRVMNVKRFRKNKVFIQAYRNEDRWSGTMHIHTQAHTSTNSTRMFPFQFIITMYVVWWPFEQWIDARLSLKLILNWCS